MSPLKWRKFLWSAAQALFVGIALYFLGRVVAARWSQVAAFPWHLRPVPLVGSIILQLIAALFWATIWRHMAVRSGCPIRWADGVRIYLVSNLLKYTPGSIWGYVSRAWMGSENGLTPVGVGISVIWELGMAIIASLLLTVTILLTYSAQFPILLVQLVFGVALLGCVALLPPVFRRWIGLFKRWNREAPPSFGWRDFSLYLAAAIVTQIMVGSAFFMFVLSLIDISARFWWTIIAIWSFSGTAGLVVILAPYGLGIKEGVLSLLLQPFVPIGTAVVISLAARLWVVFGEIMAALVALVFLRARPLHKPSC